jgi:hypothetical protein
VRLILLFDDFWLVISRVCLGVVSDSESPISLHR